MQMSPSLSQKHLLTFTFKPTLKFVQHSKVGLPQKEAGFSPVPGKVFVSSYDKTTQENGSS